MLKPAVSTFLLLLCLVNHARAQVNTLGHTKNLTISDGLPHDGVTSILQDTHGFLWFGTYDGISRYDGHSFKTFKNSVDKKYFASNRVRDLAVDPEGNIWIGTDRGISVYDYELEKFTDIYTNKAVDGKDSGPIIRKIVVNPESKRVVCATEGHGVLVFNLDYSLLGHYFPPPGRPLDALHFFDILTLDKHVYILPSSEGLWLFNAVVGVFEPVLPHEIKYCKAALDIDHRSFLLTTSEGIVHIEYEKGSNDEYHFWLKSRLLEQYKFNSMAKDAKGNVWLGTDKEGGGIRFKFEDYLEADSLKNFSYFLQGDSGLRISSFYPTSTHGCWVGTFDQGVFQFDYQANPFKKPMILTQGSYSPRSNRIFSMVGYKDDLVFVSGFRGGPGLFNTTNDKFEPLPFYLKEAFEGVVRGVFIDSKSDFWLKLGGNGLGRVRKNSDKVEKVDLSSLETPGSLKRINITEDRKGHLWIGTTDDVHRLTLDAHRNVKLVESLSSHPYFQDRPIPSFRIIYADPIFDFIWIGTDADGLFRISLTDQLIIGSQVDRFTKEAKNECSLSSNFVTSIVRTPDGVLWVGTERGGVCKVKNSDQPTPAFERITERQGLSNNVVKSMQPDKKGNLWIATNVGLNKLEIKSGVIRRFGTVDGLPFEGFGYSSSIVNNGTLLFSGVSGFCYFNPDDIPDFEPLPALEFGELRIFGKPVGANDTIHKRVLLNKRLGDQNEITLKYNEDVVSLDLVSLHFSNPDNHLIRYQLLPVNEEWIEIPSSQQAIYYNGLNPGTYTLRAMASNSLYKWTKPKELIIEITAPWWKTSLAYSLYFFVAAVIGYVIVRIILQVQSLKHKVELEHLEAETANKVNAAKLRFFSNISHEIRTPLALISGPVDFVANQLHAGELRDKLEIVKRQSRKISRLINQVHDFQRADANLLKMNLTYFYFDSLIDEVTPDFGFMALNDSKELIINKSTNPVYVWADRDKLEKIVNNLIGNAFKFTNSNDRIEVSYYSEGHNLYIRISDTGQGIHESDLPHIFERFYQSDRKQNTYLGGSGIGLAFAKGLVEMHYGNIEVESEYGKGTTFQLHLPIATGVSERSGVVVEEQELLAHEQMAETIPEFTTRLNLSQIRRDEAFAGAEIFFVEDNPEMRLFVADMLSRFFQVKCFNNGQECIEAMDHEWPELIISDVLMPKLNGFDLCKAIKSDIKTSHIPVVLLTACVDMAEQIEGVQVGADAYIQKPFDMQHLVARIESLLRGRRQLRERFRLDIPLTHKTEGIGSRDIAFLDKLYTLMAQNLSNEHLNIDSFSKELYLSRSQLYRKVKILTGLTPLDLLKNYRIRKAAELLAQEELSVNEVYTSTGFKSRTHFSKLFKESFGVSPGKYARR